MFSHLEQLSQFFSSGVGFTGLHLPRQGLIGEVTVCGHAVVVHIAEIKLRDDALRGQIVLLADFLKFLQSKEAQEKIEEEGYISIYADAKAYAKPETLPATTKLNVGGSTSVQPLMAKLAIAYEDLLNA